MLTGAGLLWMLMARRVFAAVSWPCLGPQSQALCLCLHSNQGGVFKPGKHIWEDPAWCWDHLLVLDFNHISSAAAVTSEYKRIRMRQTC